MTIFNSQPINTDPFPYKCGKVRVAQPGYLNGAWHDEYLPRPEFDNNVNPVLYAFRKSVEHNSDEPFSRVVDMWLGLLSDCMFETSRGNLAYALEENVEHATKVLRRLSFLGYTEGTTATEGEN